MERAWAILAQRPTDLPHCRARLSCLLAYHNYKADKIITRVNTKWNLVVFPSDSEYERARDAFTWALASNSPLEPFIGNFELSFKACGSAREQFELFENTARRIERKYEEYRDTAEWVEFCAQRALPASADTTLVLKAERSLDSFLAAHLIIIFMRLMPDEQVRKMFLERLRKSIAMMDAKMEAIRQMCFGRRAIPVGWKNFYLDLDMMAKLIHKVESSHLKGFLNEVLSYHEKYTHS